MKKLGLCSVLALCCVASLAHAEISGGVVRVGVLNDISADSKGGVYAAVSGGGLRAARRKTSICPRSTPTTARWRTPTTT